MIKMLVRFMIAFLSANIILFAYDFKPQGFKATGMGGAGVASVRGGMATFYNPAMLGFKKYSPEFSLNVGASLRDYNLVNSYNSLEDLKLEDTLKRIGKNAPIPYSNSKADRDNIKKAKDILTNVSDNVGFAVSTSVTTALQINKNFGVGVFVFGDAFVDMIIDKDRLDLIVQYDATNTIVDRKLYAKYDPNKDEYTPTTESDYNKSSLQYSIENGGVYARTNGLVVAEIPISYAHQINLNSYDKLNGVLNIGASVKPMRGSTIYKRVNFSDKDKASTDTVVNNYYNVGIDLGAAYKNSYTDILFGAVIKNLNNPSFGKYSLNPMLRVGASYELIKMFEFAFDMDLTKNDTLIRDLKTRYISGGVEFHPSSWFSLRAGLMRNTASNKYSEGNIYTAGLGFGLKWFSIDLSAMISQNKIAFDKNDYPIYADVNLAVVSRW